MTDEEKLAFVKRTYPIGTRVIVAHMHKRAMETSQKELYSMIVSEKDEFRVASGGGVISRVEIAGSWMRVLYWNKRWSPILLDDGTLVEVDPDIISCQRPTSIDILFEEKLKQTLL